ncbi:lysophosphatidic acid receptor 6-like [Sinocyclocheilus rhinocerous]|uniref:Lysophosphatidic acid receptor 6-like n=1 Tax=Sinocyclocheilus rhinocerous TaxID=307959 RepID=A0A673HCK1_9TELE|nr:PREDICTED: lysophosphatidic acid receptor 6-like [Sinocyclocheilus rhinocerous]
MPPNNTDNCSTSHFRYPLFTSTYSIVLLFGLPLNFVSLWILVCRNGLRKSVSVIYMANLALSDLLFTLSLPFRIIYFATGEWKLGNALCMIPGTLFAVNIYSSSLFITLISVDRMLAVVYPLRSRQLRTVPMAWVLCAMVWLIITGLAVPTALNHPENKDNACNVTRCFEKYSDRNWKNGFIILCFTTFFGILVPFCIILGCTVSVVRQLKGYSMATSSCNTELSKSKIVKLFLSNLLIYAICFIPFHIAFILFGLSKRNYLHGDNSLEVYFNLQTVTMCMASTNSCLDPLIYYFSTKTIKGRSRCDSSSKTVGLGLVQSMSWNGQ